MKFRRATHDKVTGEYLEKFRQENITHFQKVVWDAHGGICHCLSSQKALTYEEILEEVRKDTTNYLYLPKHDIEGWRDGELIPTPEQVALSLVRLLEAGYVEMDDGIRGKASNKIIIDEIQEKL